MLAGQLDATRQLTGDGRHLFRRLEKSGPAAEAWTGERRTLVTGRPESPAGKDRLEVRGKGPSPFWVRAPERLDRPLCLVRQAERNEDGRPRILVVDVRGRQSERRRSEIERRSQ